MKDLPRHVRSLPFFFLSGPRTRCALAPESSGVSTQGTRAPASGFFSAALATIGAGVGMSVQGTANGELGDALGYGVFAAAFSFLSGLVILVVVAACAPTARAGIVRAVAGRAHRRVPMVDDAGRHRRSHDRCSLRL